MPHLPKRPQTLLLQSDDIEHGLPGGTAAQVPERQKAMFIQSLPALSVSTMIVDWSSWRRKMWVWDVVLVYN